MTPNEEVDHEDETDGDNYPLPDEDEDGRVAEDPEEDVGQDESDHSQGVFALVGVGYILDERDPAEDEADDGDVGAKTDFVAKRVHDLGGVLPGGLDSARDEEEQGQDDLDGRLKGAVDQAGQLGKEPVVSDHLLVLQEAEDHPESAVDGWCDRVEEDEHEDLRKGDVPPHVVLHADRHEVDHVQEGGYIVRDEHDQSILHKPSEEKGALTTTFL